MQLHLDTADIVTHSRIKLGMLLEFDNGKARRTRGLLNGIVSWKRIQITTNPPMQIDNGWLVLDYKALEAAQGKMTFEVSTTKRDKKYKATFTRIFPTIQSLEPATMEINAYVNTPLQIAACYSNGRSYTVSPQSTLPAISLQDIKVELPDYVGIQNGECTYNPLWGTYFQELPICISSSSVEIQEFTVPTNFDVTINYKTKGSDGRSANNGYSGESAPAGHNPGDGTHGERGEDGRTPNTVHVFQKKVDDIYLTWIVDGTQQYKYLLGENANLHITSQGGNGGNGGDGGPGGDGADGTEEYAETRGGRGGDGGDGGNAGYGGDVKIYSSHILQSKDIVRHSSFPGTPGAGGSKGKSGLNGSEYESESGLLFGLLRIGLKLSGNGSPGNSGLAGRSGSASFYPLNEEENELILSSFIED
jgi:hypothetical protein